MLSCKVIRLRNVVYDSLQGVARNEVIPPNLFVDLMNDFLKLKLALVANERQWEKF
jgi:hypothetical protein